MREPSCKLVQSDPSECIVYAICSPALNRSQIDNRLRQGSAQIEMGEQPAARTPVIGALTAECSSRAAFTDSAAPGVVNVLPLGTSR